MVFLFFGFVSKINFCLEEARAKEERPRSKEVAR